MRDRFYLYFSKHNAQDQHLSRLIRAIPEKQRNNVIKHILLGALSSRSKHTKTAKDSQPARPTPHTEDQLDLNSQLNSSTQAEGSENPLSANPLANLQRALNKIPLKRKG